MSGLKMGWPGGRRGARAAASKHWFRARHVSWELTLQKVPRGAKVGECSRQRTLLVERPKGELAGWEHGGQGRRQGAEGTGWRSRHGLDPARSCKPALGFYSQWEKGRPLEVGKQRMDMFCFVFQKRTPLSCVRVDLGRARVKQGAGEEPLSQSRHERRRLDEGVRMGLERYTFFGWS